MANETNTNSITIKTNNQFREVIFGYQLTEKEKAEFDYLSNDELESNTFFRYKKQVYDLSQFMRIENNPTFSGFDGYMSDSYFSGILVKYSKCGDGIKVAQYFS